MECMGAGRDSQLDVSAALSGGSMGYRKYGRFRLWRWLEDFILALLGAFIGLFAIHKAGWVESIPIPGGLIGRLLLIAVVVRLWRLSAQIFCPPWRQHASD